jgi:hypothetical protein
MTASILAPSLEDNMKFHTPWITFATTTLVLIACNHGGTSAKQPQGQDQTRARSNEGDLGMRPASRATSNREAIEEARCAQEQHCENIGPDKKYVTVEDCMMRVGKDWSEQLDARECPAGTNQVELDKCVTELRGKDCGELSTALGGVTACSVAVLCQK